MSEYAIAPPSPCSHHTCLPFFHRYVAGLNRVLPQLQQASAHLLRQLQQAEDSLEALSQVQIHGALRDATERFVGALHSAIAGSANPGAVALGQTLDEEEAEMAAERVAGRGLGGGLTLGGAGGSFGTGVPKPSGAENHLYGGAQFYRLIEHFTLAVGTLEVEPASDEERANFAGIAAGAEARVAQDTGRAATAIVLKRCAEAVRPLLAGLHERLYMLLVKLLGHARIAFSAVDGATSPLLEPMWEELEKAYRAHLVVCVRSCLNACEDDALLTMPDHLTLLGCGPALGPSPRGGRVGDMAAGALTGLRGVGSGGDGGSGVAMVGDMLVSHSVREWKRRIIESTRRKAHANLMLDFVASLKPGEQTHTPASQPPHTICDPLLLTRVILSLSSRQSSRRTWRRR